MRRRTQWILLSGVAIVLAAASVVGWHLRERRTTVYTDAQSIRLREEEARLRQVLWQPAVRLPAPLDRAEGPAYDPAVADEGFTLIFARGTPGGGVDLYQSRRTARGWSEPEPLSELNSEADELGPALALDGDWISFSSDRAGGHGGHDLWAAPRGADGFGTPINLGPRFNTAYHETSPAPAPDGRTLYFASNRPALDEQGVPGPEAGAALRRADVARRDDDIYVADLAGEAPATPLAPLNSPFHDSAPALSPAGDFLYFSSDRPDGHGGFDIWRSRLLPGGPLAPQNVGEALNGPQDESDPVVAIGGFGIYFSSDRQEATDDARTDRLYFAASREVFADVESWRASIDWMALWIALWPALLALLLGLLLLLALLRFALARPERLGAIGLLARCLLGSLALHLLLLLLLSAVHVTTTLAEALRRPSGTKVLLTAATSGGDVSGQVRGLLTAVAALAPEAAQANRQTGAAAAQTPAVTQVDLAAEAQRRPATAPLPPTAAPAEAVAAAVAAPRSDRDAPAKTPMLDVQTPASADAIAAAEAAMQLASEEAQAVRQLTQVTAVKVAHAATIGPETVVAPSPKTLAIEPEVRPASVRPTPPRSAPDQLAALQPAQSVPRRATRPADRLAIPSNESETVNEAESSPLAGAHPPVERQPNDDQQPAGPNPAASVAPSAPHPRAEASMADGGAIAAEAGSPPASPAVTRDVLPPNQIARAAPSSQPGGPIVEEGSTASATAAPPRRPTSLTATGHAQATPANLQPHGEPRRHEAPLVAPAAREAPIEPPRAARATPDATQLSSTATTIASPHAEPAEHEGPHAGPEKTAAAGAAAIVDRRANIVIGAPPSSPQVAMVAGPAPSLPGEPGSGEPGSGEPGSGEPGSGEPGSGEPGSGEPGSGELTQGEPGAVAPDATAMVPLQPPLGHAAQLPALRAPEVAGPARSATHDAADSGKPPSDVIASAGMSAERARLPVSPAAPGGAAELTPAVSQQSTHSLVALARTDAAPNPTIVAASTATPLAQPKAPALRPAKTEAPAPTVTAMDEGLPREREMAAPSGSRAARSDPVAPAPTARLAPAALVLGSREPIVGAYRIDDASRPAPARARSSELPPQSASADLPVPAAESARARHFAQRAPEVREQHLKRFGGGAETEQAVKAALDWMARHQGPAGNWPSREFDDPCGECGGAAKVNCDVALSGLALLCYLAADHSPLEEGPYRSTVQRALAWLVRQQEPSGNFAPNESLYSHGIATIALAEAYALTADARLEAPLVRAVQFIDEARNRTVGGWRYDAGQAGDTSVLGWQIMALSSARRAGIAVPAGSLDAARQWLDKVGRSRPGLYAYQPGHPVSPAMTAEGLFVRQLLAKPRLEPESSASVAYVLQHLPDWSDDPNTYFWYYATLSLFQHGGEAWSTWNEAVKGQLLAHQRRDGRAAGSWDPLDTWASVGGRVYQTAICTLTLEVYYRYLPLYVTGGDAPAPE